MLFCTDLPTESTENGSTIRTVLVVVLMSTLAFLTVTAAFIIVLFVCKKKKERKIQNLPEHVYESVPVLQPPGTLVTSSKPSKPNADLRDNVKITSCSTATQFELTDNNAYCSSSFKPPAENEVAPGTDPE